MMEIIGFLAIAYACLLGIELIYTFLLCNLVFWVVFILVCILVYSPPLALFLLVVFIILALCADYAGWGDEEFCPEKHEQQIRDEAQQYIHHQDTLTPVLYEDDTNNALLNVEIQQPQRKVYTIDVSKYDTITIDIETSKDNKK